LIWRGSAAGGISGAQLQRRSGARPARCRRMQEWRKTALSWWPLGLSSHGSRRMERQKRCDLNALALGVV
jgi:hypothetical protein